MTYMGSVTGCSNLSTCLFLEALDFAEILAWTKCCCLNLTSRPHWLAHTYWDCYRHDVSDLGCVTITNFAETWSEGIRKI
jgi:hypothetical protein